MAYDTTDLAVDTQAKVNLIRLRDFLATLAPERFNITRLYYPSSDVFEETKCGTAACIAGWACTILGEPHGARFEAQRVLGLNDEQGIALFCPYHYQEEPHKYTLPRAVAVLDHLIATGEVDWSVA